MSTYNHNRKIDTTNYIRIQLDARHERLNKKRKRDFK
jgi:hypothetical protein